MNDNEFNRNIFTEIWKFITNRLLLMSVVVMGLFYLLSVKLFNLQIVEGPAYAELLTASIMREIPIAAPRGTIYDKFGRPLAVNNSAYSVKIDPSVSSPDPNKMLYELIRLFEAHNQSYVDNFPITAERPYEYQFDGSASREKRWKEAMTVPADATAEEAVEYLREHFGIDTAMSAREARKLLALRADLYQQRWTQYNTITVAYNVKQETLVDLEERTRDFPGVYVEIEPQREYPAGIYMSHMLGYIGRISEEDLEANKDKGYKATDNYGRTGIERAFEAELHGQPGSDYVETDNRGTRLRTTAITEPVQGNKVFLTVDSRLQKEIYRILEDSLKDTLKAKIVSRSTQEDPITLPQLFSSMVRSNETISVKALLEAFPGSDSYAVKEYILSVDIGASTVDAEATAHTKEILAEGISSGRIKPLQMLLVLHEQNIISGDDTYITRLKKGQITPTQAVLDKLETGEITPQMTNLDPSTGSVVLLDVNTGGVIAAVGYPSFDNNQFVNNFNNEYYKTINSDLTYPQTNRPFMEPRAPGSTFKMISAIAGLETGTITKDTRILDEYTFKKAGTPYSRCWSTHSHGQVNVVTALEVSCNYFFCEVAYRMGNARDGNSEVSIANLNRYMEEFGLNDRAGVEIGERSDSLRASMENRGWPSDTPITSAPEFKEYMKKLYDPDVLASDYLWYDGDTVKTAFGQAYNDYTPVSMAKFIATLASRGDRYQTHLLDRITTQQNELVREFKPVIEWRVNASDATLDTVYQGMLAVTQGNRGTAASIFRDFPINVAGKTGTAQERSNRADHSSFGGFAPYENPEVTIYVQIPFGTTKAYSALASQIAKKVLAEYFGMNNEPEYMEEVNVLTR